jgi:ubiquinol-cytochrome c reductase iron-sulfur subunit
MKERIKTLAVALAVVVLDRHKRNGHAGRPSLPDGGRERVIPDGPPSPGSELVVLALFGLSAVCAVGFIAVYAYDGIPRQTQFLGLSLGLSLLFLAVALILTAKRLIVTEEIVEDYPLAEHPEEQDLIVRTIDESGSRLSRRRLFRLGLFGSAGALGAALVVPLASLGPFLDMDRFYATPWRHGRRLVDEAGRPLRASDIEQEDFYTAFAEGADREQIASSVVLVRLASQYLSLPPELAHYPAHGIVAYSKICTHAGCAISLYRAPLFQPDEPRPALVCPCHYSTFDPGAGGKVTFGPAGRKLPMLPLLVDRHGFLRAAGNFDEPVGPSWWGVRMRGPT